MVEFRCIRRVSQEGSMIRRLASLPWLRPGTVRQLPRYYQGAMTSCRPSRRTSLPSFGGTSAPTRPLRSPADECTAEAWSWSPGVSGRALVAETAGSRKFLGHPDCPFAHVQSTPAGLRSPDHGGGAAWPLGSQKQRLPRKVFRRSIAWPSDWLSTLRRAGYPHPTQDSLPAAGQALPDGLSTRRVPLKGFRALLHLIPLSQASCRNQIDRRPFFELLATSIESPLFGVRGCTRLVNNVHARQS